MCSVMFFSFGYLLECFCMTPSFFWWLLLGGWLNYLLHSCCEACSWMWLWCSNCLHINEIRLHFRGLLMSNVLAMMFQIVCFLRWCYVWLALFALVMRNVFKLILGCVVGLIVSPLCGE